MTLPAVLTASYDKPHIANALVLALVGLAAVAYNAPHSHPAGPVAINASAPPVFVKARPQQAFPPLHLTTETHQVPADVAGREVCVQVLGPQEFLSCWQDDNPVVIVNRTFDLYVPGDYEVQARVGNYRSNLVKVVAVSTQ